MYERQPGSGILMPMKCGVSGRYRLRVLRQDGSEKQNTGWFSNLITDWGLNAKGDTGNLFDYVHVGTGGSSPTQSDNQLESWLASTNDDVENESGQTSSNPYYAWMRKTLRFGVGEAEGNISEVGVSNAGGSSDSLFSRALVVDSNGDPTTISVQSDELLDVEYEFRVYAPTDDGAFQVSDGADTYDVTVRACGVGDPKYWPGERLDLDCKAINTWGSLGFRVFDGAIGPVDDIPEGSASIEYGGGANDSYSNNSLERTGTIEMSLGQGNLDGGVRSILWVSHSLGSYQAEFDPPIPKDDTKVLDIGVKVSWSRASI